MLTMTAVIASFLSCGWQQEKYIIGVSQCSEDSWRQKLKEELEMATYFNEGVTLRFACAKDDSRLQQAQIDSLVESGIDLLIVSPNQVDLMCDDISGCGQNVSVVNGASAVICFRLYHLSYFLSKR